MIVRLNRSRRTRRLVKMWELRDEVNELSNRLFSAVTDAYIKLYKEEVEG